MQSSAIGLERICDVQQQRKQVWHQLWCQLQADCQSRQRECAEIRRELEEMRMEESLINLEIRRRENTFRMHSTTVENLENQQRNIERVR